MILKGKTAIVTGASRGIGLAIASAFLSKGSVVYGISRKKRDALEALSKIADEHDTKIFFRESDVSDEAAITTTLKEIIAESGSVDILVNNAGITRDGLVFRMNSEKWNEVLHTNLSSVFFTSKLIAFHMAKQRSGSIINISSIVGITGNPGQTNYSASKAGIIGFTKSLAREVAERGVRVNAVAPGYIETDMTEQISEAHREAIVSQIPMKRTGAPEDIAQACLFLASDHAAYITGHTLHVTGGMGM